MLDIFKKINRLLYEPLTWDPIDNEETKYFTIKYSKDECWLQMNDFPEESLWTLFYKGKSIDIEDTPIFWKINYRNNKATQWEVGENLALFFTSELRCSIPFIL